VVAGWLLVAGVLSACSGGDGATPPDAPAPLLTMIPPGPVVSRSLVTVNTEETTDCGQLASALAGVFDSLGTLSADEAARLDPALIDELGRFLAAVEQRRAELGCDERRWREDTCRAMAGSRSGLAARFLDTQCAPGPADPSSSRPETAGR
jgi:hypothetical protein